MGEPHKILAMIEDHVGSVEKNETAFLLSKAAACIREMVEWRPIETAPRDGAVFLVGYDDKIAKSARLEAHQRVYEARWCERQQSFAARNGFILHDGATHWLPLPPAPGAEA